MTIEQPGSLFVDKIEQFNEFYQDIQSYDIGKILKALDPNRFVAPGSTLSEENMIPNVCCPWACSEFLYQTKTMDLSLIMQHHLPHAIFNLPSPSYKKFHLFNSSRYDCLWYKGDGLDPLFDTKKEEEDYVKMNRCWYFVQQAQL